MSEVFLDTNVLLHAFRSDDPAKQARAIELLRLGMVASVQTLNEFTNAALRKVKMDWPDVDACLSIIRSRCRLIIAVDETIHADGVRLAKRYKLSVYDAMHLAAALVLDCRTFYSEDMHAGLVVDGRLTVTNPFIG